MVRVSRRRFIASSAAAGLAGVILPQGAFGIEAEHSAGRRVSVKATGDARSGYQAIILFSGRPIVRHRGGEFSAFFHNSDHSIEDRVDHWRAVSYTESEERLLLEGNCKLPNFNANILVKVVYKVLTPKNVRKKIHLYQTDMYDLLYQVTNALEPFDPPASLWSFNEFNCKGGPLHEPFPAAGFRTHDNATVGLLTDSGY